MSHLSDLLEVLCLMRFVKFLEVDLFQVAILLRSISLCQRAVLAEKVCAFIDDLVETTSTVSPELGLGYSWRAVGRDASVCRLIVAEDLKIIVYDRLVKP